MSSKPLSAVFGQLGISYPRESHQWLRVAAVVTLTPPCCYALYCLLKKSPIETRFEQASLDIHAHKLPKRKRNVKDTSTSLVPDVLADIEEDGGQLVSTEKDLQMEIDFRKDALQNLGLPHFKEIIDRHALRAQFVRTTPKVVGLNIGLYCNQACNHCHVESSPLRKEQMTIATADRLLALIRDTPSIDTLDITGGAPELNQAFEHVVRGTRTLAKQQGRQIRIIDRCNLTVLCEPGMEQLPKFLSEQQVDVIASLPCYSEDNCDKQRGRHVFERSIKGLQILNEAGYGKEKSELQLDLVYNPLGAFLPPPQAKLEKAYKENLKADHDVSFNSLYTLTNLPIKRFYDFLRKRGELEPYMELLVRNFNKDTVPRLMCRDTVAVSWDGYLYDCDFNMQLGLHLKPAGGAPLRKPGYDGTGRLSLWDIDRFDDEALQKASIRTMAHCFGCTAGQGSS
jgi:radical SAM/Cys-rich protein